MSYIEKNLLDGEKIIEKVKIHWILFLQAIIFTVVVIGLFFVHSLLGLISILIALYLWVRAIIVYLTDEFAITNKRLIIMVGFIRRDTLEILFSKLESISLNQSILGRILGYGAITVAGSGSTRMTFNNISKVKDFRKKIESMRD